MANRTSLATKIAGSLLLLAAIHPFAAQPQTFTEVGASAGMNDGGNGYGMAWGDYDGDGYQDVYIARPNAVNLLMHNERNGTFLMKQAAANVDHPDAQGAVWGDYDNDGDLDLYAVGNGGNRNHLYRNNGNGTLLAIEVGAYNTGDAENGAWGDYDNDGYLDLFIPNLNTDDRLFRNNGNGTFTDMASSAGVANPSNAGKGNGCAWGDYDSDGDLDLYVSGDASNTSFLYRNNGNGTFSEVSASVNAGSLGVVAGVAWGDYDNDQDLDLYLVRQGAANRLLRNDGGTFTDVSISSGTNYTAGGQGGFSAGWGDYDNDGFLDLYVDNSGPSRLFHNNGNGTFSDASVSTGVYFASDSYRGGAAWADYDNDGDLDIYEVNHGGPNRLYRNNGTPNRWLMIKLVGALSNRGGVGARVTASTGGIVQRWDVEANSGYWGQNSMIVHFGLGNKTSIDQLTIRWPSGTTQVLANVPTNQILTVTEAATYTISASAGTNGSISPSGSVSVSQGGSQTFTATPNTGYHIADVLVDNASVGAVSSYTFSNVTANHTISASFALNAADLQIRRPVLFSSTRDGNWELYTMNADGSSQTRLTNSSGNEVSGKYSPDGTRIVFDRDPSNNGHIQIFMMNADGTGVTQLTNNWAARGPSWSPDGTKIAFFNSPDNNTYDIYTMNADGSNQTRLTNNSVDEYGTSWSPDGAKIAFVSLRDGSQQVYVMNADGSGQTRLTFSAASESQPVWSPDGSRIAFGSSRDGNQEIYVMNAGGSGQTRLTNNPASDENPTWSQDGTKIMFSSDRDGNFELYSMNADGSNQTRLTTNPATEENPGWAIHFRVGAPFVGSSAQRTLTIDNKGNGTLTVSSITTSDGQFTVGPTNFSVPPGGSQDVTVGFVPTSAGVKYVTLTILSDDQSSPQSSLMVNGTGVALPPSISISDVSVTEGNSGTTNAVFTVSLSSASSQSVKVAYSTTDGTAVSGSDYVAQSNSLIFAPGEISKPVSIAVNGDVLYELDETFSVDLNTPTNATIADSRGIGTIVNDDPNTYTLTASAGAGGSISPSGVASVNYGDTPGFTISPDAGYHIADVLVDGISVGVVGTYTFTGIAANHTISASFAINTYTITSSVVGANGSISPLGVTTINYGADQQVDITPATGYHIADVLVDNVSVGTVPSYPFTGIAADHTISASFAINTYTITSSVVGANGSISPLGVTTINYGADQQIDITPETGYYIADVLVDNVSVGTVPSYPFTGITADHTISASFAINTYTITSSVVGGNGSISPLGVTTINYGADQQIDITPETGYHIADVLVDGISVGAVTSHTIASVTADHTIEASFAINSYTVTSSVVGANGSISPSATVNYGDTPDFTITPATGYHVADVLVDNASVGAVGTYIFTGVTADHTISASFAINTYTITSSAGAGGSISPSGTTTANYGNNQTYTFTPATGYGIADVQVDGTSVGPVSSYTFTNVTANHTIAASFVDQTPPTLTLNGANPLLLELGTAYLEPGATASDLVDGNITRDIQTSGRVNVNAEDSYTLAYTVSDAAHNTVSASRLVQVVVTPNSYGLIATHSLHLRQNARVLSGFAGVVNRGQAPFLAGKVELVVGTNVQTGPEVRLSAPRVRVRKGANIAGKLVYNELVSVEKRATIADREQVPQSYFPLFQGFGLPAFQTGTPGSRDVEVKQKGTATLSPGAYGEIQVKQKGTLTFTGGTYQLGDLEIGEQAKVICLAPTTLLIRGQLHLAQKASFGPGAGIDATKIRVYVEGRNGRLGSNHDDDEGDDEEDDTEGRRLRQSPRAVKVGEQASFQGNLYAPNGTLHLRQGSTAVGSFIARDIIVGVRVQVAAQSGWNTPGVTYQPQAVVALKLAGAPGAEAGLPDGTGLLANYPNPFNPSTAIPYVLAEAGLVKLSVYNVLGQQIRVLVDQLQVPGAYTVSWDGLDAAGQQVAGGVYFYRLEAGTQHAVGRMLLLR